MRCVSVWVRIFLSLRYVAFAQLLDCRAENAAVGFVGASHSSGPCRSLVCHLEFRLDCRSPDRVSLPGLRQ